MPFTYSIGRLRLRVSIASGEYATRVFTEGVPGVGCSSRSLNFLVIVAFGLLLAGCSTRAGWQYQPSATSVGGTPVPVTVAVEHFQDQRGTENSRYFWLCIIPLVPYCSADYKRPENANGFLTEAAYNFRPSDDLAQATADELRQAGLFREVYVTDRTSDPNAQLLIRGYIVSTDWDGSAYSYLVGPYAGLFYVFGLPIGTAQGTLNLRLELVDNSNGQILWTQNISQSYEKTEGLYYNYAEDFGYPQMFHDGIKPAIASLQSFIASRPAGSWNQHTEAPPTASHRSE